jgi:hypothetical protein
MAEHEVASRAGLVCRSPTDSRNGSPSHKCIRSAFYYAWEANHLGRSCVDNVANLSSNSPLGEDIHCHDACYHGGRSSFDEIVV